MFVYINPYSEFLFILLSLYCMQNKYVLLGAVLSGMNVIMEYPDRRRN